MFRIGGHESGDSPAVCSGDDSMELDHFFLVLVAAQDKQILLTEPSSSETPLFPSLTAKKNVSWKAVALELLRKVYPNYDCSGFSQSETSATATPPSSPAASQQDTPTPLPERMKLIRILRLWFPSSAKESTFRQRMMLHLAVTSEEKKTLTAAEEFTWTSFAKVLEERVLDPELTEFVRKLSASPETEPTFSIREFTQESFMLDPDSGAATPSPDSRRTQALLMKAAKVQMDDQKRLFREFFSRSFPRLFVDLAQFRAIMAAVGWNAEEEEDAKRLRDLFRCFNLRKTDKAAETCQFISYPEMVCGLCACEPGTPHGDNAGEARCRYIFRYYNRVGDGRLTSEEFRTMVRDIRERKGFSTDPADVENEANVSAKVFGCEENDSLVLNDFLTGVGQLKFRGTSLLLRSEQSAFAALKEKERFRNPSEPQTSSSSTLTSGSMRRKRSRPVMASGDLQPELYSFESMDESEALSFVNPACENGGCREYDFATHVVKVKRSGHVVESSRLWDFEVSGGVTESSKFTSSQRANFGRLNSIRAFSVSSEANEMLKGLRYFERAAKTSDPPKTALSWGRVDMRTFAKSLIELCTQTRGLIIQEPRLVKLASPTYILGDLHGNFQDLICFEKVLWRMGPKLVPANFLFLGDYVDRGQFGVEVVAYLFSQKIAAPTKFHLLRGNHECREIQLNFTFHKECVSKFGEELGEEVWEAVNKVFDVMPIAAVIDSKIFCVHGGIPPPWYGDGLIGALDKVNKDLPDPNASDPLVWEYLWNDPLPFDVTKIPDDSQEQLKESGALGFVDNYRRGTGHMFSETALDEFLRRNGLSHVIRAHEVKAAGFQVQHGQKLLTVFSSSKYCNGSNEAACVLADNNRLRLIRLDTS